MKYILLSLWLFINQSIFRAQEFRNLNEILKIIENSILEYRFVKLEKTLPISNLTENLNSNDYYISDDKQIFIYAISEQTHLFYTIGQKYFNQKQFDSAANYFYRAYENQNTFYKAHTDYAITLFNLKKYDEAHKILEQVISKNFIDYKAHWYLGKILFKQNRIDYAINSFALAHILNRNHPEIKKELLICLKKRKYKFKDWFFHPQFEIEKIRFDRVKITTHPDWVPSAMVAALWENEPDFAQYWNNPSNFIFDINIMKFYEMFFNQLAFIYNKDIYNNRKKYPAFYYMKKAFQDRKVEEFIYYEMILPYHPHVSLALSEKFIQRIKLYLLDLRFKN